MFRPLRPIALRIAVIAVLALFLSPTAHAQQAPWYSPDNSPPGTPAQLVFDMDASSPTQSFFDVYIHGFYYMTRMSPTGQPFTQLMFPGLSRFGMGGEPDLPAVQVGIAVPPGASLVTLDMVDVLGRATFLLPNLAWPVPIAETDTTAGRPEQFVAPNPNIYQGSLPWPPTNGDERKSPSRRGGIPGAALRLYPVHWTPSTNMLDVMTHVRYQVSHPGTGGGQQQLTKDAVRYASTAFLNWSIIKTYYPPNGATWSGDYLIVTESKYANELYPLVIQKAARGYAVTIHFLTAGEIGSATAIRSVVAAWYGGTSPWRDHYALLVGDQAVIPLGTWGGVPTDDLYADADGDGSDDLNQEVYVGRLSCDDEADVQNQVTKWLKYMDNPNTFFNYRRDLLVGHKENAPGKYVGCLESVANYGGYVVNPTFTKLYGHLAGNTNTDITDDVNAGFGIVTYRGHGDWDQWWNWDIPLESYFNSAVDALTNPVAPVLWSIACTNSDIKQEDCFGEHWMERPGQQGAVSFYGASEASGTDANHILTRALHRGVFRWGFTKQGRAIAFAESQMYDTTASLNSQRYLLLGDPDMDVRRGFALSFLVARPLSLPVGGATTVPIRVMDSQNQPIPNALVAAYKPAGMGGGLGPGNRAFSTAAAEFVDNHYTDDNGGVNLNGNLSTDGWLYFGVRLDEGGNQGEAMLDSIPVGSPAGVGPGFPTANVLRAFPSISSRGTRLTLATPLDRDAEVVITDLAGRVVREIPLPNGGLSAVWDGLDAGGVPVASGIYFARVRGSGSALKTRVAIVH